ncbi:hypothetical protein [Silvanigrella aquatica]|uniref:GT44 domain-containing protein n=1 Tax=Silvanigrella aquatica TaxID=1915309 RepID=A0A1L4D105_9BACT|nr:hypothetical protein [Silvanigrella aquatica]APJ03876.1 hypothetical protein AXG55_08130 [Silvanigrella aquatica]
MPNINDNTIFISFFWTGSVPSVELKNNLGEWKKYLSYSNSNAEILLWTTHNDIEKIKQKNQGLTFFNDKNTISQLKEISPNIYNWSLPDANGKYHNIKVIEIENLISKYKLVYKGIIDIFNLLIKNNIYVFSSDLARILILDFLPGIYIDCDIENSSRRKFYSNIQEIKNKFQSSGFDIKFYYIMMVGNQGLLENQMIIAFEKNAFENVLQYYELQLNDNSDFFNDHIEDIESFKKNINHEKFMKLNKSFFNDKNDSKYLQFYNKEDYKNFRKLNENENISFSYPCLSFSYELLGIFFKYKNSMEYSMFYTSEMSNYFKIPNQDILLYSWKNPGFARLKKL